MGLASFTVENYRAFPDETRIELRPLTLLFGYNSAGKSALLRALPLLGASVDANATGPLSLRSGAAREATFDDLRSRFRSSPVLRFELSWDDRRVQVQRLELLVRDLPEARQQIVEQIRVWDSEVGQLPCLELIWRPGETPGPGDGQAAPSYAARLRDDNEIMLGLDFEGLLPTLITPETGAPPELIRLLHELQVRLRALRSQVHWIGSLRALPPRRSTYTGRPRMLRLDGTGAVDVLAYDALEGGAVLQEVSAFYERSTRHRLELRQDVVLSAQQYSVVLSPLGSAPIQVNIVDTGEGMAQVLPVIVLGAMARHNKLGEGAVLAIEQPELHLHPGAHADLAGYFCDLARQPCPPRSLIETHSENFLLRVQLEIARGDLSPHSVLLYWVRHLDDGRSVVERITFDEFGRPEGDRWPPGVFSEDVAQAREIMLARRKRSGR